MNDFTLQTPMNAAEPEERSSTIRSRVLLGAYLVHLLVPLVLVADSLRSVHLGAAGVWEKAVVVIGTIWVVVGLGALAFSRNRGHFLVRISRPLMAVYTLYFSFGAIELGVETWFHRTAAPLHYKPGSKIVFERRGWGRPGVPEKANFTVNELGLRGPSLPHAGRVYKIIAVGGSTTECNALDDSQEWPHLLMQMMNDQQKQESVWVANAGVSGSTTVDHLSHLKKLPILGQADHLVFMIGVNDLQATLDFGGAPTQKVLEFRAERFVENAPRQLTPDEGIFRRSYLFGLAHDSVHDSTFSLDLLRKGFGGHLPREPEPQHFKVVNRRPIVPLPDLQTGLHEYAQRIRSLEGECRSRGLRCAFLTQPSIWRADLSPAEQDLLWMGWVGWKAQRRGFAPVADLARAMGAYNQTLLSVCREDRLECYDVAAAIPKDTSAFYDDCHFNAGGARMVAEFLAARLLAVSPFSRDTRSFSLSQPRGQQVSRTMLSE